MFYVNDEGYCNAPINHFLCLNEIGDGFPSLIQEFLIRPLLVTFLDFVFFATVVLGQTPFRFGNM